MARPRPQLVSAKLDKLHPTQLTVGMAEVALKRQAWTKLKRKERAAALDKHS
ncbi:ParB-like protein [Pseudomonas palleroniana]